MSKKVRNPFGPLPPLEAFAEQHANTLKNYLEVDKVDSTYVTLNDIRNDFPGIANRTDGELTAIIRHLGYEIVE